MKYLVIFISVINILLLSCGNQMSGNVVITGNPTGLRCQFYYKDSGAPAKNIKVKIYEQSRLADTSLKNSGTNDTIFTTDINGEFLDTSLSAGVYVVEGVAADSIKGRVDSVVVTKDSVVTITDTLQKCGSVNGSIYLSEGGDCRKVFILVYGSDRLVVPDSLGKFSINNLAPGSYNLKIIPSLDNYGVIEKMKIDVKSNGTTDLGSLALPYTGIPSVKGLAVEYDSLKETTLLKWNAPDTSLVKGVVVYRKQEGEVAQPVATVKSNITSFMDTTAVVGLTYVYQLRAQDKDGNEGNFSSEVKHTLTNPFTLLDTFTGDSTVKEIKDIVMLPDDRMVIVDFGGNQVQLLDKNGKLVRKWGKYGIDNGEFSNPVAGAIDDSGYIYILEMLGDGRVQKFDTLGNFVSSIIIGPYCKDLDYYDGKLFVTGNGSDFFVKYFSDLKNPVEIKASEIVEPQSICVNSGIIYASDVAISKVYTYSLSGTSLNSYGGLGSKSGQFNTPEAILVHNDNIFIVDQANGRIQVFNNKMAYMTSIACINKIQGRNEVPTNSRPRSIAFDSNGKLYFADATNVYKCELKF